MSCAEAILTRHITDGVDGEQLGVLLVCHATAGISTERIEEG